MTEAKIIELHARAMCSADGYDPDEAPRCYGLEQKNPPMWRVYVGEAKRWLAALEVNNALKEASHDHDS
jgi:hypothetical protein